MIPYLHLIGVICLVGSFTAIIYGAWCKRHDAALVARKRALDEAVRALRGPAWAARKASEEPGTPEQVRASTVRAYLYDRAAIIVRSIPVDRL